MDMGQIQKVIIQQSNDKTENYNKMKKDILHRSFKDWKEYKNCQN